MISTEKSNVMISIESEESLRAREDTKRREAEQCDDTGLCRAIITFFCLSGSRYYLLILSSYYQFLVP